MIEYKNDFMPDDYKKVIADCKKTFKNRKGKEGNTFLCSGGIRDILACLYIMKKAGGGVLYLNFTSNKSLPLNRKWTPLLKPASFTHTGFEFIKPLLEAQPYVKEVKEYTGSEEITFDLDCFRVCYFIPELLEKTQGVMMNVLKETWGTAVSFKKPWIEVPEAKELDRDLIVSRAIYWHGGEIMYSLMGKDLTEGAFFVGNQTEYISFINVSSSGPWYLKPKNMFEYAEMVMGAKRIICNDCDLYWLSLSLGAKAIDFELCPDVYTCLSDNKNVKYFMGDTYVVPDVSFITGKKKKDGED